MDFIFLKMLNFNTCYFNNNIPSLLWSLLQFGERQEDSERLDEKDLQHLFHC